MSGPIFDPSPQGSVGWLKARIGHLTASRMGDVLATKRNGEPTTAYYKYRNDIVAERMTDSMAAHFVNRAMQHGLFWEYTAREAYEAEVNKEVTEVGFAAHESIEYFGASSDGLVDKEGMIEIKCPTPETFLSWISYPLTREEMEDENFEIPDGWEPEMPKTYIPQMTAQCVVLQKEWCDFVAFSPSDSDVENHADCEEAKFFGQRTFPESMRLKIWRFTPTQEQRDEIEERAIAFLKEVDYIFDAVLLGS